MGRHGSCIVTHFEAPVGRSAWDIERSAAAAHPTLKASDSPATFWMKVAGITLWQLGDWAFKAAAPPADDPWGGGNWYALAAYLVALLWLVLAVIALLLLPLGLWMK